MRETKNATSAIDDERDKKNSRERQKREDYSNEGEKREQKRLGNKMKKKTTKAMVK